MGMYSIVSHKVIKKRQSSKDLLWAKKGALQIEMHLFWGLHLHRCVCSITASARAKSLASQSYEKEPKFQSLCRFSTYFLPDWLLQFCIYFDFPYCFCSSRTRQSSRCTFFLILLKNYNSVTKYKFNKSIIGYIQTIQM